MFARKANAHFIWWNRSDTMSNYMWIVKLHVIFHVRAHASECAHKRRLLAHYQSSFIKIHHHVTSRWHPRLCTRLPCNLTLATLSFRTIAKKKDCATVLFYVIRWFLEVLCSDVHLYCNIQFISQWQNLSGKNSSFGKYLTPGVSDCKIIPHRAVLPITSSSSRHIKYL